MYTTYRVYMTPRNGRTTYGAEIEVTDYIRFDGLPVIKRSIDSTDFEIGVYSYDDLSLKALNVNGYFNDEFDWRSIFQNGRDKTRVRVVFSDRFGTKIVFRGLINEEATKLDADDDEISFRVLSRDSVIRNTKVSGGTIPDGALVSTALYSILNVPEITSVLNVSALDINPNLDFAIDDGDAFSNKSTREVLNQLLLASNSVMLIDADDNVIVRDRAAGEDNDPLLLYGPFDLRQRTNMISLKDYNSGRQRMFTAVKINNTEVSDPDYVTDFGYRQKKFNLDFVTTTALASAIGNRLLGEFKVPKTELKVVVPTYVARTADLLDRVSVEYPLRVKPIAGSFLPIIGVTKVGETSMPLPRTFGSVKVDGMVSFKIVEIAEDPKEFLTTFKLRQSGTSFADGYFNIPESCILGFAKIGDGVICSGGTACDKFEIATIGAAQVGCTILQ